jgi:hypothetical protein
VNPVHPIPVQFLSRTWTEVVGWGKPNWRFPCASLCYTYRFLVRLNALPVVYVNGAVSQDVYVFFFFFFFTQVGM